MLWFLVAFVVIAVMAAVTLRPRSRVPQVTNPATPPDYQAPLPETGMLGPYRVEERLGDGAMATIYRVCNEAGDLFAAKVPHKIFLQDKDFLAAFEREAQVGMDLTHPSVVRVVATGHYRAGGHDTIPYFVMELVQGRLLAQVMQPGQALDPTRAVRIARALIDVLEWAHKRSVIHRDITPANILLTDRGEVKMLDFGISGLLRARMDVTTMSRTTLQYLPPERIANYQLVDPRCDLYSVGVLFYQMLTGELPLTGQAPTAPSLVNPRVDRQLDQIVIKLLDPDPTRRFQQARAVISALAEREYANRTGY